MASRKSVKDILMQQTLKGSKFIQFEQVLYKRLTAMCTEGKPVTEPVIIEKLSLFMIK
jgi:hypothetical protein